MNATIVNRLQRHEKAICKTWTDRLAEPAMLAAHKLQPGQHQPVQPLFHEMIHLLRGGVLEPSAPDVTALYEKIGPLAEWRINLCQGIEVLLTGEVVVRRWARCSLDLDDGAMLDVVEELSRTFHQLMRVYCLQYCDQCHAVRQAEEGKN